MLRLKIKIILSTIFGLLIGYSLGVWIILDASVQPAFKFDWAIFGFVVGFAIVWAILFLFGLIIRVKYFNKILAVVSLLFGIFFILMGITSRSLCIGATRWSDFIAMLPFTIFGVYLLITSLFAWRKPKIGVYLLAIAVAIVLLKMLNLPLIIKLISSISHCSY